MSNFNIKVDRGGSAWKVTVAGNIDEDVDFAPHSLDGAPQVQFFLGDVKSINSCGIREWIKWVNTAGPAKVEYNDCPKVIVDQINMVQGFLPSAGRVLSFFVPYYSDDSGSEKSVLFKVGQEFDESGNIKAPEVKDEAGKDMEMDVVEAKYFKFLKK